MIQLYHKKKIICTLLQVCPQDFAHFVLENCIRILDDIFHKWFEHFDIFYDLINSLDEDLKFIFENPRHSFKNS